MPFMDEAKYFETIGEYKLLAKHEVGQNFLIDPRAAEKIVSLADLQPADRALEIGSGAGSLSFFIAQKNCVSDLIDIDESLVLKLQKDFANESFVHPQMGNVMRWQMGGYTKIIGNLPYYITSGILERILLDGKSVQIAVLMVQKEVLSRLSAPVGDEDYGPLPILLKYRGEIHKEFLVPRTSFSPAPHVDSVVFSIHFDPTADLEKGKKLYGFVSALFLHRRKTILNNLGGYLNDNKKASLLLAQVGIDERKRPEDLSLLDYENLLSQLY
jgi:16S rRNA (adenine1518-N6/adenine1519-N6)-dimethyltransferase